MKYYVTPFHIWSDYKRYQRQILSDLISAYENIYI